MADPHTKRGGQELPAELQDRPEQNAGYDEAVRGGDADPNLGRDDISALSPPEELPVDDEDAPDMDAIDVREARGAAADVRRRDRAR
jgi:chromatin segregation and condensation protein Rec8/ScpA/Scc1 (kleisin family)